MIKSLPNISEWYTYGFYYFFYFIYSNRLKRADAA